MRLLLNLETDVEVVQATAGDPVAPDWTEATLALMKWDGVKNVTINLTDSGEGWWNYTVTMRVNARKFTGEEAWQMCREQFKEDGEPIEAAAIVSSVLSDEGGWDAPFHDAIAPHLPGYMLTVSEPPEIEEAQP